LHQLERNRDVASAVLSNPYTRVVFRVGDADAKKLAEGFAFFESRDLQNLEIGQAITRIEKADNDFNLTVPLPEGVDPGKAEATRQAVVAASRAKYATPRAEVEAILLAKFQSQASEAKGVKSKPAPPPPTVAEVRISEVPKPTVSEKGEPHVEPRIKSEAVSPATLEAISNPTPPRDLGRGGAQHQAIQQRLKTVAEELGFRAIIERQILDGQGSVDLLLERHPNVFAVEISVTTTVDHEIGNVVKCVKAGFQKIVVIAVSVERLQKMEAAVHNSLGADIAGRVSFFLPDDFAAFLKTPILETTPPTPADDQRRGYRIKRTMVKLSPEETKAREAGALQILAESMKERRKPQ
jgi:hypothetical protein